MEDYDVLGNFKDLKSIFRNIPSAPTAPLRESTSSIFEDSLDNSDILADLEANIPTKVSKSVSKSKKTEPIKRRPRDPEWALGAKKKSPKKKTSPKKQIEKEDPPPEIRTPKEGVGSRTRRSLRIKSAETQNSSVVENLVGDGPNTSTNSGKKSKRGKGKATTTNSTFTTAPLFTNSRGRGKKNQANSSTRGRRNNVNSTQAEVPVIELDDNMGIAFNSSEFVRHSASDRNVMSTAMRAHREFQAGQDAMRARRVFIAEQAARCPTVGVVDLVSSPLPPMPTGVIDLEAEDNEKPKNTTKDTSTTKLLSLDLSFDEDNPEMSIKINWQFKPQVFKLRKYQKFATIFKQLAERENIELDQIFLNLNSQIIKPDDTPASINYKIFHFIEGRAMNRSEFGGTGAISKPKQRRDPNVIKLKVQSDMFKKPLIIEMNKTENFRKLMIKCSEELQVPYENITKMSFDGETIDYQQTPVDLELEGGEIIEIHLKK